MIRDSDQPYIADAPQHYRALTVLGWFFGISRLQLARWPGNDAEVLLDPTEGLGFLKSPGYDQNNVVRLIILLIKSAEVLDRDLFNIAAVADRRLAVIVPM